MAKAVTHKQIYRRAPFGSGIVNRTVCGRVSNASDDMNVGDTDGDVTCKLCLRLIAAGHVPASVDRRS